MTVSHVLNKSKFKSINKLFEAVLSASIHSQTSDSVQITLHTFEGRLQAGIFPPSEWANGIGYGTFVSCGSQTVLLRQTVLSHRSASDPVPSAWYCVKAMEGGRAAGRKDVTEGRGSAERGGGRIKRVGEKEGGRGRAVIRNVGERRLERAASSVICLSLSYSCTHTQTTSPWHFSCLIEPELPRRITAWSRTLTSVFVVVCLCAFCQRTSQHSTFH